MLGRKNGESFEGNRLLDSVCVIFALASLFGSASGFTANYYNGLTLP